MITLIMCSRIEGNYNHGLLTCLHSIADRTVNPRNIEVLVKFDECDDMKKVLWTVGQFSHLPFPVRYITTPRLRGYIDVHIGYKDLVETFPNAEREVVGAIADDFIFTRKGWDEDIQDIANHNIDFIIHQMQHDRKYRLDQIANGGFNDVAPFWSETILDTCKNDFLMSFTDLWTLTLEYYLRVDHGVDITHFVPQFIERKSTIGIDDETGKRWNTDRQQNLDYVASDVFQGKMKVLAEKIGGAK